MTWNERLKALREMGYHLEASALRVTDFYLRNVPGGTLCEAHAPLVAIDRLIELRCRVTALGGSMRVANRYPDYPLRVDVNVAGEGACGDLSYAEGFVALREGEPTHLANARIQGDCLVFEGRRVPLSKFRVRVRLEEILDMVPTKTTPVVSGGFETEHPEIIAAILTAGKP